MKYIPTVTPEWESEEGIAARFCVSIHFVRKLRYAGRLRASTINGRLVRIRVSDARDFFERNASGGDGKTPPSKGTCAVWAKKRSVRPPGKKAAPDGPGSSTSAVNEASTAPTDSPRNPEGTR